MSELFSLTKEDLFQNISQPEIRKIQVIQIALLVGMLFFLGIAVFLYVVQRPYQSVQLDPFVEILLLKVLGGLFLVVLAAQHIVTSFVLRPMNIRRWLGLTDPGFSKTEKNADYKISVLKMTYLHRTITLIRLALLNGSAMFGIVIILLAVINQNLRFFPVLWLALIPVGFFFLFGYLTFPTKSKIVEFIDVKILYPLKTSSQ